MICRNEPDALRSAESPPALRGACCDSAEAQDRSATTIVMLAFSIGFPSSYFTGLHMRALGMCISAGDKTLRGAARQTVHAEPAGRLAAAVETGDHLAVHIDHLAAAVDPQSRACVVEDRR